MFSAFSHGHSHGGEPCHGHGASSRGGSDHSLDGFSGQNLTPEKIEFIKQMQAQGRIEGSIMLPAPSGIPVPGQRQETKRFPGQPDIDPRLAAMVQQIGIQQQMIEQQTAMQSGQPAMMQPSNNDAFSLFNESVSAGNMMNMAKGKKQHEDDDVPGSAHGHSHSCSQDDKNAKLASVQSNMALAAVCQAILRQKPEAVNEKDEEGNTLLHRVCASGMVHLVMLLVDSNADINATNNLGQTPVHLACRSGKTMLVHMMRENGGNLEAKDEDSWGVMHHAAAGGSVHLTVYLSEVCGLQYQDLTNDQQSMLHIAVENEQVDMVNHLLKKNRCDIHLQDKNGNTALHIACIKGFGSIGWKLMSNGGIKMLHVKNKENANPVDMASRGRSSGHYELTMAIQQYYLMPDHNFKPDRPLRGWYYQLLGPQSQFVTAILLSWFLTPESQGWLATAGVVLWTAQVFDVNHRMSHISKFPSPSRLGGYTGGFFHAFITLYFIMVPVIWVEHSYIVLTSCLLTPITIYLFYQLVFGDPGWVTESKQKDNQGGPYTMRDLVVVLGKPEAFCARCELIPSKPTKHCKLCDRCVYIMDHHCLYTMSCIGHKNHRAFVFFILSTVLLQTVYIISAMYFIQMGYMTNEFKEIIYKAFFYQGWIFVLAFCNMLWAVFGITVFVGQIRNISKGYTFVFQPSDASKPCGLTNVEKIKNVVYFFLGKNSKIVKDPCYIV